MLVFCIINADHGVPRSEGLYIRPHLPLPSNKNLSEVGRGGAIGKTRGSESDDRLPLVSGWNPVAAAFANLQN